MRLTSFFLLIACMHVFANTSSQHVTFSGKNISLEKIFPVIKKQTGFLFFYNLDDLSTTKPITVEAKNMALQDFLNMVFTDQPLGYRLTDNTIILSKKNAANPAHHLAEDLIIAFREIKGKVLSSDGIPISGASIALKGSKSGTISDQAGNFSLNAETGKVLEISSVGYESQEVLISASTDNIVVTLAKKVSALDETIIMAYGTTTQRLNTGNIAKVSGAEIEKNPVGNVLATLDGRVPGLVVTQTTGLPGGAFKVELRGRTAIDKGLTDDQPLFVIDGIPLGPNNSWASSMTSALGTPGLNYGANLQGGLSPLNNIDMNNIASMEVLKDADATAIYGSRGANGVILITTKKGKAGKLKIDFNTSFGKGMIANKTEMYSTEEYVAMRKTAFLNDNIAPTNATAFDILQWDTTRHSNPSALVLNNKPGIYETRLSLSGGSEQTQFLIGGSLRNEATIHANDFRNKRTSVNFNINHRTPDDKFNLLLTASYTSTANILPQGDPYSMIVTSLPHLLLYNEDGTIGMNEKGYSASNPMMQYNRRYYGYAHLLQGNIQLIYKINNDLLLRTNIGYNGMRVDETSMSPSTAQNPLSTISRSTNINTRNTLAWLLEPQAEYTKTLGRGTLNLMAGISLQATENTGTNISAWGFSTDEQMLNIVSAPNKSIANNKSEYHYSAGFGRLSYNLLNKYLLNMSARRDGSSRFGPGKKMANFGAIGTGWIFSKEDFMQQVKWLSFGKLRASYGTTGNDKISDYQYLDTWMSTPSLYEGISGLYPNKLFNGEYRWEKTTKTEVGLELGIINDVVLFTLSRYSNRSSNQLVNYKLPSITGFYSVVANLPAIVSNTGWELTLNTTQIRKPNFSWETSFNITIPKNKLVSFPGLATSSYASTYVEGHSLNLVNSYKYTGIDPKTGLFTFEDKDKNGKLEWAYDRFVSGDYDPVLYGGLGNTFKYKQLSLNILFSYRKQMGGSYIKYFPNMPGTRYTNLPKKMSDFWYKEGDVATLQRLSNSSGSTTWSNFKSSDGSNSDASYIKLKNIELSYAFSQRSLRKLPITQWRVFAQAQNLLTITPYELGDPETQFFDHTPPLLYLNLGIQITF